MTKGKGANPGAGNLDKHIKRTEHKERSQLASRKHLGQLEKKKDHAIRAKRRKAHVQRLASIKRAVAQRNPDEFHIGMTKAIMDVASGKMKHKRGSPEGRRKEMEQVLVNNTRNAEYLKYKAQGDLNRARELIEDLGGIAVTLQKPVNTHKIFVETDEEFKKFRAATYLNTTEDMLTRDHPAVRGRLDVIEKMVLPEALVATPHTMLTESQRRKQRREMQEKLSRSSLVGEERRALLTQLKERARQKELRRLGMPLDDATEEEPHAAKRSPWVGPGNEEEDEEEEGVDEDPVESALRAEREQTLAEKLKTARRLKEMQQRYERSRGLLALAHSVQRQSRGIKQNLNQRHESKFKSTATRRLR